MNLWNKILLGLIGVVSLGFFYFGARALRIHQFWGERMVKVVGQDGKGGELDRLAEERQKTLDDIRVRQRDLFKLTAARGRVWPDCQPQKGKLDPATGEVSVVVPAKEPAQFPPTDSEVFIFQDAVYDAQGKPTAPCVYLGEFSVAKIDKNQWLVRPSRGMTEAWLHQQKIALLQEAQQRLQRNQPATWTIYQVLPKDDRDYEIVFNDFYRQMKSQEDAIARGSQELKTLQDDQAAAAGLVTLFTQQKAATEETLKAQQAQRQETEDLCKRLDATGQTLRGEISETIKANQGLAAEIAKLQLDALRRIREQTPDVDLPTGG